MVNTHTVLNGLCLLSHAAASIDKAKIIRSSGTIDLPYASDTANAASNSNAGVPGKYVVDINGKSHSL